MDWMLMPYRRYADFSGRSRRREYWMFTLLTVIVAAVSVSLMLMGGMIFNDAAQGAASPLFWAGMGILLVFGFGSIVPSIAVQVRRFHDQDRSGWLVLLGFIPYLGGLIVLVFMCIEGTRGRNRFGPDPKGEAGVSVFS